MNDMKVSGSNDGYEHDCLRSDAVRLVLQLPEAPADNVKES
jgi:hypothetical protein